MAARAIGVLAAASGPEQGPRKERESRMIQTKRTELRDRADAVLGIADAIDDSLATVGHAIERVRVAYGRKASPNYDGAAIAAGDAEQFLVRAVAQVDRLAAMIREGRIFQEANRQTKRTGNIRKGY